MVCALNDAATIDPGVNEIGVAIWEGPWLVQAFLVRRLRDEHFYSMIIKLRQLMPTYITRLAIEKPRVYAPSRSKGDPNDLIDLAFVAGATIYAAQPKEVIEIYPATWKGQVPKPVMVERVKSALTPKELPLVELPRAKSLQHNVWDAVGIGLYLLREKRKKARLPCIRKGKVDGLR